MISATPIYPFSCNPDDMLLAQQEDRKFSLFFPDVHARGHYPAYVKKEWERRGYQFDMTENDFAVMQSGCVDYIGFSYYMSSTVGSQAGGLTDNPHIPVTDWGWSIDPKGLRYVLNQYYERYELPLFIVENGFGYEDCLENGQVHDENRIAYLKSHIEQMMKAVDEDGVDLMGYTVWGCIDPVSFTTGEMRKRYGFIYVDKMDDGSGSYKRIPKDSFTWYKNVIASNGADL